MELRQMKYLSFMLTLCVIFSVPVQTTHEEDPLPWAQYLKDFINNVRSELPPNFEDKIFGLIPNKTLNHHRPSHSNRTFSKFTPATEQIGHEGNFRIHLYKMMITKLRMPKNKAHSLLARNLPPPACRNRPVTCVPVSIYRSINGSCNNFQYPYWGAAFQAALRILPEAEYEDDLGEPRGGTESYLPNPRKISTTLHYDVGKPDPTITNMVPQIGQFLTHDVTLEPNGDKRCCDADKDDEDCWPIQIPHDDPFFSTLDPPQTCMTFTRSTPFCFPARPNSGVREAFNTVTSFIDGSQLYGSETERADLLREFKGGRLTGHSQNSHILPPVAQVEAARNKKIPFTGKYLAGDDRVNAMPALTTLHTLLFLEHNRIARGIEVIRPDWTDEAIYQESRRIVIAEWQNTVYSEYLPIILGPAAMQKYDLDLGKGYSVYRPTVNPTIHNEFATAAFRFGHTLVNGIIQLYKGLQKVGSYYLKNNFFEPEQFELNGWDGYNLILGGLMVQNSQQMDGHFADAVTSFLLSHRNDKFGSDLVSTNIHRGRDHGIAAYSEYRKFCNLTELKTWVEKPKEILQDSWDKLKSLYRSPLEIDLFSGGLSEVPLTGALTGPTFNCLMAFQFKRLKDGDRFFFTHAKQVGSFTPEQLKNLRARTLGDIICENSNLTMTTVNVFRTPSESNPQHFCSDPSRNKLNFKLLIAKGPRH